MSAMGKTSQLKKYAAARAEQMAIYWLRWLSNSGDKGLWSESISAVVSG
jgi:hypothetical protein